MENIDENMIEMMKDKIEKYERYKLLARERARRYYQKNKKKIKEERKNMEPTKSMPCECGGKYQQRFISVHVKTKKHKKYLENLEILEV